MAHSCNPYEIDESVIRRNTTFRSIELNLKFHDETDTNLSIAISKEIQNGDKEKVRLELRNGEQLAIFDGKKKVDDPQSQMIFSASGTQREDKDLVDVGLNWMLRQLEDDIQIVVDAGSQDFEPDINAGNQEQENNRALSINHGTVNFDIDSALEPLKQFFNEFIDVVNHEY